MYLANTLSIPGTVISLEIAAAGLAIYLFGLAVYNRYFHPYSKFPGPFWASITDLWYFFSIRCCKSENYQRPVHEKYGPIVRIGPDKVQICDEDAIETIYGSVNVFPKGEFYDGWDTHISPRKSLFDQRDEKIHADKRRVVAPLYTPASMLQFEPCVDRVIALFYEQMDEFAKTEEKFDMAIWLRKYTFDVVGEIFYGRKGGFGFVRDNVDYSNWCHLLEVMPPLAAAITYLPKWLRPLAYMADMMSPSTRSGAKGFFDVIQQSRTTVSQRKAERAQGMHNDKKDLLNRLLDLVNDDPSSKVYWTEQDVATEIWATIWAGSDSTSISLITVMYHLHKNPETLVKLRSEVEEAFRTGDLKYPLRYADCIKLPYLHAVVRESWRIHNPVGMGLPRYVPAGGAQISGHYFPAGYTVQMNGAAVHLSPEIFGSDAAMFNPDRWISCGEKRASEMERRMLHFGKGGRACIGRHLSMIEMYKLLPTILRDFEFDGLGPGEKEWEVTPTWFALQKGLDVQARRRRAREEGVVVDVPEGLWRAE